ncbi:MAG: T9SS type A sorting domain-containing protein [Saprospiraceae bacterium]|nr:T9SS type A sorting domain-containing protein [Saprospiraceae bacterium]
MKYIILICAFFTQFYSEAQPIIASPADYSAKVANLMAGDTLILSPGIYTNQLKIYDLIGTEQAPIVIIGNVSATVFTGNACCNTVSIKKSAFVELHNLLIDGQNIPYIDAIKAEGTTGNWAHHITLDNMHIIGHGGDQQTVGISTKCPAWDWVIKHCYIDGAGTGMYLGNSDGSAPFVNGLIEYNLITNTVGYNTEIKHQNVGSRNIPGMTLNGKTIIRHNVWTKVENASSGANARPNLLVGHFPATGDGANDVYEIYGNLFWQNPVESLFQGTGNIAFYDNICINQSGGGGITFQNHNGFPPRNIHVFHNTIISNQSWGVRLSDTDPAYQKYIYGNAVFSDHSTPIRIVGSGITTAKLLENVVELTSNANAYIQQLSTMIETTDVFPIMNSPLKGSMIPSDPFLMFADHDQDFNGVTRDWSYRGAYHGEGNNPGWQVALEEKPVLDLPVATEDIISGTSFVLSPNPARQFVQIEWSDHSIPSSPLSVLLIDGLGRIVDVQMVQANQNRINLTDLPPGMYWVQIRTKETTFQSALIKL